MTKGEKSGWRPFACLKFPANDKNEKMVAGTIFICLWMYLANGAENKADYCFHPERSLIYNSPYAQPKRRRIGPGPDRIYSDRSGYGRAGCADIQDLAAAAGGFFSAFGSGFGQNPLKDKVKKTAWTENSL